LEIFEDGDFTIREEDIQFDPENKKYYTINPNLLEKPAFKKVWETSDLPDLLHRFSKAIFNHYITLSKHHERTEKKIRNH
jgi:inorganic pyrophosphatase